MQKVLAGLLGALVVGGIIGGVAAWQRAQENDKAADEFIATAQSAQADLFRQQSSIQSSSPICSPTWIQETAVNLTTQMGRMVDIASPSTLISSARAALAQYCKDGDTRRYCTALMTEVDNQSKTFTSSDRSAGISSCLSSAGP